QQAAGVGHLDLAVIGERDRAGGVEVLDRVAGGAVNNEQAVDVEDGGAGDGGAAAVDGGVLQLERGAAGAAAVGEAVDLDPAALGGDVIVQRVVEQQQAAGVG